VEKAFFDDNGILCFGTYHPRRGGSNPKFDAFSESILTLKDGPTVDGFGDAFVMFEQIARRGLSETCPDLWRSCAMAVVPSHDPDKKTSGISKLAQSLTDEGRTDATTVLVRFKKVAKQAVGGTRDINHHIQSIQVDARALPKDRMIVVIDDVTTTGNSLLACRKLLIRAGIRNVLLCSLAKTAKYGH